VHPRHVYLHVPFCARRCAYCDFSIAVRRVVPVADYVEGIARELALRFPSTGSLPRWDAETLYLGGGTPSRLGGEGVARLLGAVRERVTLLPGAELTLEANPEDVTPDALAAWRDAGVNRLSLGGQSFDEGVLRWMHRGHDAAAIVRAVEQARDAGFAHVSFDLIFALPPALGRDWTRDLERAIALAPSHLSLYGLTVEPGTPLGRWRDRGETAEAPEEQYEREFLEAHDRLTAAGFAHYEVSNFAGSGGPSRHNGAYWRGVAYAGLGPSAHEFDGAVRRWNVAPYAEWLRRLRAGADPAEGNETLTDANRTAEAVYLGLRTSDGLLLVGDAERSRVVRWVEAGWATLAGDRLTLTATGWLRLDALAADLTLVRSRC
jgi:oxygen-independent coproporphyrinogen III oxidase